MTLQGQWDGVWNSGVMQCYEPSMRALMVEKLCSLGPKSLFIFPDLTNVPLAEATVSSTEPGILGCKQYNVPDLPCLISMHCSTVVEGIIERDITGVSFPFRYVYGERASD